MKRTMLAILALSSVAAFAQTKSPAQPESTPVLQSANVQPALFAASNGAAAAAATPVRVSTGVTAPILVHQVSLTQNPAVPDGYTRNRVVDLSLVVDATGKPTEIKVVKSAGAITDDEVVNAVSSYRYKPATLN